MGAHWRRVDLHFAPRKSRSVFFDDAKKNHNYTLLFPTPPLGHDGPTFHEINCIPLLLMLLLSVFVRPIRRILHFEMTKIDEMFLTIAIFSISRNKEECTTWPAVAFCAVFFHSSSSFQTRFNCWLRWAHLQSCCEIK